jgi:hypothetical protein
MSTAESSKTAISSGSGIVLMTLASGQFLMTLDSSVMNVSIAQVAKDGGTTVTGIQTAITLYSFGTATLIDSTSTDTSPAQISSHS